MAEACVIGIPDALKGHLPFAFVTASQPISDQQLLAEIQTLVRTQIGAIATLGGMIQGRGMIPKTRSGKTMRRVLRELVENAVHGEVDKAVDVPSTVEDMGVVDAAREAVRAYFRGAGERHSAIEIKAKL